MRVRSEGGRDGDSRSGRAIGDIVCCTMMVFIVGNELSCLLRPLFVLSEMTGGILRLDRIDLSLLLFEEGRI